MRTKILWILLLGFFLSGFAYGEDTITVDPFGEIHIYPPAHSPAASFVLMVSGDGGWVRAVVDLAERLAGEDSFVVGISVNKYLRRVQKQDQACSDAAADFDHLSHLVQEKYGSHNYLRPILIGYSSGATLVYATLVQADPDTFLGAFSFGFCPDLPLTRPFCKGAGLEWTKGPRGQGYSFLPARNLQNPWVAFQGSTDQVCNADATDLFVKQVPNATIVLVPKAGHGFRYWKGWMPEFKEMYIGLTRSPQTAASVEKDTAAAPP